MDNTRRTLIGAGALGAVGALGAAIPRGPGGGNPHNLEAPAALFADVAALGTAEIEAEVLAVCTAGYHEPGDGGAALYLRVATEPSHLGKVQSVDGAWWELARNQKIYPEMFGARGDYDPTTGSGSDDAPAINQALAFAGRAFLWRKAYKIGSTVLVGPQQELIYEGSGYLNSSGNNGVWAEIPCATLVPRGLAAEHTVPSMITECELSGGVLQNPNAGEDYTLSSQGRLDTYRLIDFTNQDAAGATAATPREFSVAVKLCRYGLLRNVAIRTTATDGAFYPTSTATDHGDPVDIGVLVENGFFARIEGCTITWAFRIAALAHMQYDAGDGFTPQGDCLIVSDSLLEGYRCVAIRHFELCAVTSCTASTISIGWFRSHRFAPTGSIRADGRNYTYTSLVHNPATGELTFGGLSDNPVARGLVPGDEVARTEDWNNSGIGETCFDRVFFRGMTHPRLVVSTDASYTDVFGSSAALIEISGAKARGVKVANSTLHSREDLALFVNDGGDIYFNGIYHEAKSNSTGAPASRFVALSREAKQAGRGNVPHPAGEAAYIEFRNWSQTEAHTDRTPTYRTATNIGRFGPVDGLFEPNGTRADDYPTATRDGTVSFTRAPWARDDRHPLRVIAADGHLWASFDQDGRFAVGDVQDTEMGLTYASQTLGTGNVRQGVISTDDGEAGLVLSNAEGAGELVAASDGALELRVASTPVTRWTGDGIQIRDSASSTTAWAPPLLLRSGSTAERLTAPGSTGTVYFDTTLGHPIWWTGSSWVDASGTGV